MSSLDIEKLIEQKVQEKMEQLVPHNCFYCALFQMSQTAPHNRACMFKGKLKVEGDICTEWKLAEDWRKRKFGNCAV